MTGSDKMWMQAQLPPGLIVYAIGDIHGRRDLLDGALGALCEAARAAGASRARMVAIFLGDYVDRGPDSRGVIEQLIAFRDSGLCETVFLRGNHEQVVLDVVDGAEESLDWLKHGGLDTLASYDVVASGELQRPGKLRALTATALPPAHLDFLRSTELMARFGGYVFVHAGLRPDRLLEEQASADLLWFRYRDDEKPVHSHTVVHGHSPNPVPVLGRHRIGIDTEAYASGALTLLRLEADRKDLLKVEIAEAGAVARLEAWSATASAYQPAPRQGAPRRDGEDRREERTQGASYAAPAGLWSKIPSRAAALAGALALVGATAGFAWLQADHQPEPLKADRGMAASLAPDFN